MLTRGKLRLLVVGATLYANWEGSRREVRFEVQRRTFIDYCCGQRLPLSFSHNRCPACQKSLYEAGLYGEMSVLSIALTSWADWLLGEDLDVLTHGLVVPELDLQAKYLPEPWGSEGYEFGRKDPTYDESRVAPDLASWLARLDCLDLVSP